jgi:hypothetical protein
MLLGASICSVLFARNISNARVMGLFWSDWWEAAVLFATYLWGKPQPRACRGECGGGKTPT